MFLFKKKMELLYRITSIKNFQILIFYIFNNTYTENVSDFFQKYCRI